MPSGGFMTESLPQRAKGRRTGADRAGADPKRWHSHRTPKRLHPAPCRSFVPADGRFDSRHSSPRGWCAEQFYGLIATPSAPPRRIQSW
jgi:hypothetical protein